MATNNTAYYSFVRNMASVDDLLMVYNSVSENIPSLSIQADEILRASIVICVSALDNFMHDFYRTEIVESYLGTGNFNVKFENLNITISGMRDIDNSLSIEAKRNYMLTEMRKIQRTETYQSPKSIEYIFNNLNVKNIWAQLQDIGVMKMSAIDIKNELATIIDRRNKISHESDWDFINEKKYPIDFEMAKSTVDFIKSFVDGVNKIA